jgi:5-methylcytosine-specific restriction endonuclease McrA
MNERARKQGVPGRVFAKELFYLAHTPRCYQCGRPLDFSKPFCWATWEEKATFDHVVPQWRGGPNEIANLEPCCSGCNWSLNQVDQLLRPELCRAAVPQTA